MHTHAQEHTGRSQVWIWKFPLRLCHVASMSPLKCTNWAPLETSEIILLSSHFSFLAKHSLNMHHQICGKSALPTPLGCTRGGIVSVQKHTPVTPLHSWTHQPTHLRDFPGGPVVKTPRSQCRGPGFDP